MSLRVVTYNTQAGLLGTSKFELLKAYLYVFKIFRFPPRMSSGMRQAVIDAITLNADVVCLNEVPQKWILQVQCLLKRYGYPYSAASITSGLPRWAVGTIVASKHPAKPFAVSLPKENTLQGGGGTAGLFLEDLNILFIGIHLGWEFPCLSKILTAQVEALDRYCQDQNGKKIILAGDFNIKDLRQTPLGYLKEQVRPTFPSWNPDTSLDHILASGEIVESGAVAGRSDHKILWADIDP